MPEQLVLEQPVLEQPVLARKSERLASLDVFRGITMAGMILVNNPGGSPKFGPLEHAHWNGWTPTDMVFPSFLFIVGVALTFSFDKRIASGFSRLRLFEQVCRRTIILFLLGLFMYGFPDWRLIGPYILMIAGLGFLFADEPPLGWPAGGLGRFRKVLGWALFVGGLIYFAADFRYFNERALRIPGVLQRIAVCYFIASIICLYSGVRGRIFWTAACLFGYWAIVTYVKPPTVNAHLLAERPLGVLHDWLDVTLLGRHIYSERPDPEGILSTIPAVATALLGVLTGNWLAGRRESSDKTVGLFFAGNLLLVAGLWMNDAFPINKKIWTSSYVLFAAGIALNVLAMCYWLVDVKGYRRWAKPFMVFGTNAIAVYFASGIFARILIRCTLPLADGGGIAPTGGVGNTLKIWALTIFGHSGTPLWPGKTIAVRTWLYESFFTSWASPMFASFLFALAYVLVWLVLTTPLYRRRIFIKV